jgi:hypothetical protein
MPFNDFYTEFGLILRKIMRLLFTLFGFFTLSCFSQEQEDIYSIYFNANAKPSTEKLNGINELSHGIYNLVGKNENDLRVSAGNDLIVDHTGIYLQKNTVLSISRTEIRENSKYKIRDGYLHGVVPNDSVMVALEGESYYFLLPQKSYLYEPNKTNPVIYKGLNLNEYVVLSKESNGYLSALYISFSGDNIQLKQLDLEQKEFDFKVVKHEKIMEGKIQVYILNPSPTDWKNILRYFTVYDTYVKQKI